MDKNTFKIEIRTLVTDKIIGYGKYIKYTTSEEANGYTVGEIVFDQLTSRAKGRSQKTFNVSVETSEDGKTGCLLTDVELFGDLRLKDIKDLDKAYTFRASDAVPWVTYSEEQRDEVF